VLPDLGVGNVARSLVVAYDDVQPQREIVVTNPRNSGEFAEVVSDGFKRRVGFDSMHVKHPQISGLVFCPVHPCRNLLLCINIVASSEERRSVDEYNALHPLFFQVRLGFISQFTSNRLNLRSEGVVASATFDPFAFCRFLDELRGS